MLKINRRAAIFSFLVLSAAIAFFYHDRSSAAAFIYTDIELDEARGVIYASDFWGNHLDIISMETFGIIDSLDFDNARPAGLDMSPDGQELAIALYDESQDGEIAFLDLDTQEIIASVPPEGTTGYGNLPFDVIYGRPDRLYTVGAPWSTGNDYIHVFDTVSHTEVGRSEELVQFSPRLAVTPDNNTLYVSEISSPDKISRFDISGDIPVLIAEGPHGPITSNALAVSDDAGMVYSSRGQIWSADLADQLGSFDQWGEEIAYAPGRDRIYVSGSTETGLTDWVFGYDATTFAKRFEFDLNSATGPVQVDSAEEYLYVATLSGIKKVALDSESYAVYVPVVSVDEYQGIYGYVKDGPIEAYNLPLDLRFFNGSIWSTRASTTTDSDGMFKFTNAPDLLPGQFYYVRYMNDSDESNLFTWHTPSIDSYSGENLHIGDLNVKNIYLGDPLSGWTVSLPFFFMWDKRSGITTDSYEFNLFDYTDGDPYFYTDPPLGFVNSYKLNGLPPGFETGTWYLWDIWVYDGLGGFGISYWASWVAFSSGATMMQVPSSEIPRLEAIELDLAGPPSWPADR